MGQILRPAIRLALGVAITLLIGACSDSPTEASRQIDARAARLNSSTQADPTAQGVFIGGGAAAAADTSGTSRGVFIGGGM